MSEFCSVLKPFQRLNSISRTISAKLASVSYTEQISLADFCPPELLPSEVVRKDCTTPFLHKIHELNPSVLLDVFIDIPLIEQAYESFHPQDKSTFFKYLVSLIPYLEKYTIVACLDNFRIKRGITTAKITKNIRNSNAKTLPFVIDHLNKFIKSAHRPAGYTEQIFEAYEGLKSTIASAGHMFRSVTDNSASLSRDASAAISTANTGISELSTRLNDLVDDISPKAHLLAAAPSFIEEITNNVKKHSVALALQLKMLFEVKDQTNWMSTLITITSLLGLNAMVIDKLISYFSEYKQQSGTVKLLATISVFMGKYSPIKLITGASLFTTVREVKAIEELMDLMKDVASEWGLYDSPEALLAKAIKEEVTQLLVDLIRLETLVLNEPNKFLFDVEYNTVKNNYSKVIELEKRFISSRIKGIEGSSVIPELAKLHTSYKALNTTIENIRRGQSRRQEPVAVIFLGDAGIGKSQFAADLVNNAGNKISMLAQHYKDNNYDLQNKWNTMNIPAWQVWNENVSETMDYADGYVGQEIHTTDDIFQSSSDNDHQRYINYISPLKFLTNQAALESKGRPYDSKLFIGTCNKFPTSSKTIKEIKALQRRFIVVECSVKPGYTVPEHGPYDPEFRHLKFTCHATGVEYANNSAPFVYNKNQLLEYICDSLQEKFKLYCAATDMPYEEQLDENVNYITEDVICQKIRDSGAIRVNEGLWHTDASNPDNLKWWRIFIWSLDPRDGKFGNQRLTELINTNRPGWQQWQSAAYVASQYKLWIDSSPAACRAFARQNNYFSDYIDGRRYIVLFSIGPDGKAIVDAFDTMDPIKENWKNADCYQKPPVFTQLGEESWTEMLYRYYSGFGEICATIIKVVRQGFEKLYNFIHDPITPLQALFATITSFVSENKYDLLMYCLNLSCNYVMIAVLGCVFMCIYSKLTSFMIGDSVCSSCALTQDTKWEKSIDNMYQSYCKKTCDLGIIYNTHTPCCDEFKKVISDIKAIECPCKGSCINDTTCSHMVEDKERTIVQFLSLIKLTYGSIPPHYLSHYASYTTSLREEIIDQCKNCKDVTFCARHKSLARCATDSQLKRARTVYEDSSNSLKNVKKNIHVIEDSACSVKAKTKNKYNLENSSQSIKARASTKFNFEDGAMEEIQADPGAYNLIEHTLKIVKRCYRFGKTTDPEHRASLNGWCYKNYVITPGHLFDTNARTYTVDIEGKGQDFENELKLVKVNRERDIAIWKHNGTAQSEFIMKHIPCADDLVRNLPNADSTFLIVPTVVGKSTYPRILCCTGEHFVSHKVPIKGVAHTYTELLKIVATRSHSPGTTAGDCGSPLIMCNPKAPQKVIGFHILSNGSNAYSAVVTKEVIQDLIDADHDDNYDQEFRENETFEPSYMTICENQTQLPVLDTLNLCVNERENPQYVGSGDIEYVGEYIFSSVAAKNSNLLEHRLKGAFPEKVAPAALRLSEVEDTSKLHLNGFEQPDILQTQFNKYNRTFDYITGLPDDLADMTDQLIAHFSAVLKHEDLSPMTEEETLSGQESVVGSMPMDVRTTSGEPFSRLGRTQGKKKNAFLKIRKGISDRKIYSFNMDEQHVRYAKDVIDNKEMLASKHIRTLSLWKNCLKDETRTLDKVKCGKTRLFTAAPFDTVYLGRKYFGKFKEAWQKNRIPLFHSVGINPVSDDWTTLATYLLEHGENFGDADFSSYDGNLRADFMRAAGSIVCSVIEESNPGNMNILETLWEEYVETFHVTGTNIHITRHGNPSGNPMTTVVNCIVNLLYHWWCYRQITQKFSLSKFAQEVGFTCFGDDVLYSTNEDITGFTFDKLAAWMKVLGQDYTTAAKDATSSGKKTIKEIQFLKRRFEHQTGMIYYAPIDTDSIEQQFTYTNIGYNDIDNIASQIDEASIEACLNGREYYLSFKKALDSAIRNDDLLMTKVQSVPCYLDARAIAIERIHGTTS
jgi:hypothetical protein